MTAEDAEAFERCIADGGVALFGSDTVYGLAGDPESAEAVRRLYEIKGRPQQRPAAVMFFDLALALDVLSGLGPRSREAVQRLLPGPLTLLVANPDRRYPLACGPEPERLGLRVPELTGALAALGAVRLGVLQSSANPSGGPDASRLDEVDPRIRGAVDLEIDAGELTGAASTVVDLTGVEAGGAWRVLRQGAMSDDTIRRRLSA